MVSPLQYLHAHTGIDISRPVDQQSGCAVDEAVRRRAVSGTETQARPSNTEAIYDAVVGIDRMTNCRFTATATATGSDAGRLDAIQLGKLSHRAQALQAKARRSPATLRALLQIEIAADAYQDLLTGKRQRIQKDPDNFGSCHTLVRGDKGIIFEMTNSMSEAEVCRFRRNTAMHLNAVERPARADVVDGETYHKVALGAGSFGKMRIARNIMSDT